MQSGFLGKSSFPLNKGVDPTLMCRLYMFPRGSGINQPEERSQVTRTGNASRWGEDLPLLTGKSSMFQRSAPMNQIITKGRIACRELNGEGSSERKRQRRKWKNQAVTSHIRPK